MPSGTPFSGRYVIVADEDQAVVAFLIHLLRDEGHAAFHAYDALSATQLAKALPQVDLVMSNTQVVGADGVALIHQLRQSRPELPIIYLANIRRSTPELEAQLPADIQILREPFTAANVKTAIRPLLNGKGP
jgi:two-component system cell cycle sensor histidine kinase/response regulator CckA